MDLGMRAFDTLHSFEQLMGVGVSEEQARVFVKLFEESMNSSMENLATKADIRLVQADLQLVHAELKTDMAEMKAELHQEMTQHAINFEAKIHDLRTDMLEMKSELQQETAHQGTSLRQEIAEQGASLRQDNARQDEKILTIMTDLSALKTDMTLLKRLVLGTGALVLTDIIGSIVQHIFT